MLVPIYFDRAARPNLSKLFLSHPKLNAKISVYFVSISSFVDFVRIQNYQVFLLVSFQSKISKVCSFPIQSLMDDGPWRAHSPECRVVHLDVCAAGPGAAVPPHRGHRLRSPRPHSGPPPHPSSIPASLKLCGYGAHQSSPPKSTLVLMPLGG